MNYQQNLKKLQEDIESFNELGTKPVNRLTGVLKAISRALDELKDHVAANAFLDTAEEIRFFKYTKPQYLAERIFALEVFTIETNKPIGDDLLRKAYYESELRLIKRFLDQHRFLYQYYQLDGSELDEIYFLRSGE